MTLSYPEHRDCRRYPADSQDAAPETRLPTINGVALQSGTGAAKNPQFGGFLADTIYMRPVQTRFGLCSPRSDKALSALSDHWSETIVPCGVSAANRLGLTTQDPVRDVYLTSGPTRRLRFGRHIIELRRAPRWQLFAPHRKAGEVIRALAWLGPDEVEESLDTVPPTFSEEERDEFFTARGGYAWLDGGVSKRPRDMWSVVRSRSSRHLIR